MITLLTPFQGFSGTLAPKPDCFRRETIPAIRQPLKIKEEHMTEHEKEIILRGCLRVSALAVGSACFGFMLGWYYGIGVFLLAWVFMPKIKQRR